MVLHVTLTRTTANLIPKATEALEAAAAREGLSKTDVINRALIVYDAVSADVKAGAKLFVERPDGTSERLMLL